jgi:hypothetical protein
MQLHYSHRTPLDRAVDEIELFMAHKNYGHEPKVAAAAAVAGAEGVAAAAAAVLLLLGMKRALRKRSACVKQLGSSTVSLHTPVVSSKPFMQTKSPQQQQQQQQNCAVDDVRGTDMQVDKLPAASCDGDLRKRVTVQATC